MPDSFFSRLRPLGALVVLDFGLIAGALTGHVQYMFQSVSATLLQIAGFLVP